MNKITWLLQQLPAVDIHLATSQNDDEQAWLDARKAGIGGSEVGSICGINKWACAREVYLKKTGQWDEEFDNITEFKEQLFHFGHVLEKVVADEYTLRTGVKLMEPGVSFKSKAEPWKLANVDRLMLDDNGDVYGILECKTTSEYADENWKEGDVPIYYLAQLQWYLHVLDLKYGAIACLVGGNKYYYYEVYRNDEWLNEFIIPTVDAFWNYHVAKLIEPTLDGSEAAEELVKKLYPADKSLPNKVDLTEYYELAREYANLKAEQKKLETAIRKVGNLLKDKMGDNTLGTTGNIEMSWKPRASTRLDTTRLKVERPDLYQEYSKQSSSRTFILKISKDEE